MRKVLTSLALVVLLLAAFGIRANAVGTASGTSILNFATMSASNVSVATQSNTITTTVTAVYGLATTTFYDESDNTNLNAGNFVDYVFAIANNGNESDLIGINVGAQSFSAGAGTTANWSVAVDDVAPFATGLNWQTSGAATSSQAGDQATHTSTITPGSVATFTVRITAAADAVDGATMSVPVSFVTANTPAGVYTGINSTTYGGEASWNRQSGTLNGTGNLTSQVSGAVLTLAKAAVVTSPAGYQGLGGGATDPVPGAQIVYTITYGNTGLSDALSVQIVDFMPANTTYDPGTITTSLFGAQTDIAGGECNFNVSNADAVTCDVGTVAATTGGFTISYTVTID